MYIYASMVGQVNGKESERIRKESKAQRERSSYRLSLNLPTTNILNSDFTFYVHRLISYVMKCFYRAASRKLQVGCSARASH